MCVRVHVCVCVRERDRDKDRETGRERGDGIYCVFLSFESNVNLNSYFNVCHSFMFIT